MTKLEGNGLLHDRIENFSRVKGQTFWREITVIYSCVCDSVCAISSYQSSFPPNSERGCFPLYFLRKWHLRSREITAIGTTISWNILQSFCCVNSFVKCLWRPFLAATLFILKLINTHALFYWSKWYLCFYCWKGN